VENIDEAVRKFLVSRGFRGVLDQFEWAFPGFMDHKLTRRGL
jgi:hypothetical protein